MVVVTELAKSSTSGVKGVSGLGGLLNKISSSGLENTLNESIK